MGIRPGYKQTEIGVIPEDWKIDYIGNHCSITTGKRNTQDSEVNGVYPFFVRSQVVEHINSYSFDGEAVLTAGDGVGTGKVFHYINGRFDLHQRVYCLRDFSNAVDGYYFFLFFKHRFFARIQQFTAKTSVDSVRLEMISKMPIALPPRDEQIAISKALSGIDSLITSLEKLIEKKKLIKQGVMQELLTGKRRLPGFSGEWETKRYGDIFQFLSTANYTREDLTDTGSLKYIHYGDIHTKFENYVDLSDALIPTIQDCRLKNYPLLESGDIIMVDASEDYSGVGKSVEVINSNGCKAISGLHTILLRDISKIFADGYRAFIHSIPSVKAQLDFYATGMKVYSISKGNLARIEIPVPPKDEQEAIVNTLGRFVDEIKGLDIRLAKCKLLKQAMMQELLTGRIRLI
jgi:type I restriction enzyme S subunit